MDREAKRAEVLRIIAQAQSMVEEIELQERAAGFKSVSSRSGDIGSAFVNSPEFKAAINRGSNYTSGPIELQWPIRGKAFGDVPGGQVTSLADGTNANLPHIVPGVSTADVVPLGRPSVTDLFSQESLSDGSSVTYLQAAGNPASGSASSVAEGANKPPSEIQLASVNEPLVKIATVLDATDEILEDVAGARSFIQNQLALYVQSEEEDEVLNGTGSPDLSGILDRGISSAAAGDIGGTNAFDAMMAGMTVVRMDGGLEPDGVVMNPLDYASLLIAQSNNGYYSGSPFSVGGGTPWGLRLVLTKHMTQGHALVGAFRQAGKIYRKSPGLRVEFTNSHGTNFQKNILMFRAETRLALAVFRPLAFADVTLGS